MTELERDVARRVPCSAVVYAHVRDRNRNVGYMVCAPHVTWAQQQVVRLGYQAVVIPMKQGSAPQREIVSGCQAPKGWRLP